MKFGKGGEIMKFFWGFITGSLSVAAIIALAIVVMNRLE